MTRIQQIFDRRKREGKAVLVAYLTAGDPTPEATPGLVAALERGGADLIELGVPFSDPIADGPVIQRGSDRALKAGTTVAKVLADRETDSGVVGNSAPAIHLFEPRAALWTRQSGARRQGRRHRRLPPHRRQRRRSRSLRERHARRRTRHRFSRRAHFDAGAVEAGRQIFQWIYLSGLAYGRYRRTGAALGRASTIDRRYSREQRSANRGGVRNFDAGTGGSSREDCRRSGCRQRDRAFNRAERGRSGSREKYAQAIAARRDGRA